MFHVLGMWKGTKKGADQSPRAVSVSLAQLLMHTPSAQLVPGVPSIPNFIRIDGHPHSQKCLQTRALEITTLSACQNTEADRYQATSSGADSCNSFLAQCFRESSCSCDHECTINNQCSPGAYLLQEGFLSVNTSETSSKRSCAIEAEQSSYAREEEPQGTDRQMFCCCCQLSGKGIWRLWKCSQPQPNRKTQAQGIK